MAAQLPIVFGMAQSEIEEMSAEISSLAEERRGIRTRLDKMAIFADRTGKDGTLRARTQTELESSPEEEVLYEHRRLYEQTQRGFNKLLERLEEVIPGPADVKAYYQSIHMLRSMILESKDHLKAMTAIQANLRNREGSLETKIIDIVSERARLMARMLEHNDKMDLARAGSDSATTTDFNERLAVKYGVSVDQVDKLIASKEADA